MEKPQLGQALEGTYYYRNTYSSLSTTTAPTESWTVENVPRGPCRSGLKHPLFFLVEHAKPTDLTNWFPICFINDFLVFSGLNHTELPCFTLGPITFMSFPLPH